MQAKEYPVRLCEILAEAHMEFANQLEEEGDEELPHNLNAALRALRGHFDPYHPNAKGSTMKSDYHRSNQPV